MPDRTALSQAPAKAANACSVAYRCDGSLPGILCCIFESYTRRELPADLLGEDEPSLFPVREIETVEENAMRVWRSLEPHPEVAALVRDGWLSCMANRERLLFYFIRRFYELGSSICARLDDPVSAAVFKAARAARNEAHLLSGFIRFSERAGMLTAEISPKALVLPMIAPHFTDRYAREDFLIFDRTHHQLLLGRQGKGELHALDELELAPLDENELVFQELWRQYYQSITIKERLNPKCRMTHMPKRFWAHMPELAAERMLPRERATKKLGN